MQNKENTIIDFNPILIMMGIIVLYFVSIWIIYLEINFGNKDIISFSVSAFLFIYSSISLMTFTKRIIQNNSELVLVKFFNSIPFSEVLLINIIMFRRFGILILKLKSKRKSIGVYVKLYNEHEEIIKLFEQQNINYKMKRVKYF